MAGEKILIVDDDYDIQEILKVYLTKEGFEVLTAADGKQAVDLAGIFKPDLIILDILLPKLDGFDVCQEIRKTLSVPIIFLSCKDQEYDKIVGLTIGADDYVTKPFAMGELLARVRAHLRRKRQAAPPMDNTSQDILTFPGLEINLSSHTVYVNGKEIQLTYKEFQILALLAKNANCIFSIENIFASVWGLDSFGDNRTVIVHISNIRKKIEQDSLNPRYIQTVKGVGYKFTPVS